MAVKRHFIGWEKPALPLVAEMLVRQFAKGDTLDLSNVILVFPGRRAGRRMLELLVEQAQGVWPTFLPPRMVTFRHFPELLYPQQMKLADDLTQLLVWKRAISRVPNHEREAALSTLPPEDALPSWMKLCESLRRQHDELAAEGLDFDDVFRKLSREGLTQEMNRWKALRRIQSEYLMQMDGLELWDRQSARLIAVEQNECTTQREIMLVGTVDLNGIVKQMLDQVADRVTAIVYAPESLADLFDEWGGLIPHLWKDYRLSVPDSVTVIRDDPEDQALAMVEHVDSLNGTRRADEIAIGVADDSLVPVMLQSLARAGVEGRWPIGSTVGSSRPWRLLDAIAVHLATAQDGQPPDFRTLADLVRHVDVTRYVERTLDDAGQETASWLADLDGYLADHLQSFPDRLLGPRPRAQVVQTICDAVETLLSKLLSGEVSAGRRRSRRRSPAAGQQSLFESAETPSVHSQLLQRHSLCEWAEGCLRLLEDVYQDYEIGESPARDDSMVACITALTELQTTLASIPDAVMPTCTAAQAIPVLLLQIADRTIASAPSESAIELMGWLELPLDDSPVVTVAGFNERWIPQSVTSDIFLPNTIRAQLGLTDNMRRYARDVWALQAILNSRDDVRLISGRVDGDGDPLAPSRLWFAGDRADIAARVLQFYEREAAPRLSSAEELSPDIVFNASAMPRHSDFVVAAPAVAPEPPDHIPVTHFRDYIDSPFRYLLRRELQLQSVEDEPRELDARLFGNLVHSVLSRFGQSEAIHATDPQVVETVLLELLHRESVRRFGTQLSATVAVQLQMAEERLKAFAQWQAAETVEGWVIRYSEQKLGHEFHDAVGRTITINGRVDRIDQHHSTKQWRVLDYKTSETAHRPRDTHRRRGEWVDLQLPLYRMLVRELEIEGEILLGYVNLPGDLKKVGASIADWTSEDLAEADNKARQVAADILDMQIRDIRSGSGMMNDELARICQDTVVDRQIPWLDAWAGRSVAVSCDSSS